jgi:hypothetical protein
VPDFRRVQQLEIAGAGRAEPHRGGKLVKQAVDAGVSIGCQLLEPQVTMLRAPAATASSSALLSASSRRVGRHRYQSL